MSKACWPAPERNKGPILEVLKRVLPKAGTLLEIASGSGQHAEHFARHLPGLSYLPSDPDPENLSSIRAWVAEAALPNLMEPRELDVTWLEWPLPGAPPAVDAVFNANMLHITPWGCAVGLFAGLARYVREQGVVVLYGPYRISGAHTAESNARFDESLRTRNPEWGVRDLEAVVTLAEGARLRLVERVEMPANNQSLVFVRAG
ncbi:MAG TPA: DUF938 domain-containing protein [Polyangiaceae bacterium]|nr:DUF938 domain-containing protein [Polyangiaceae bacterium]